MNDKVRFLILCYKAYKGDIDAALSVYRILKTKSKALDLIGKLERLDVKK